MADITIRGFLDRVQILPNDSGGYLYVSEYKRGYVRNNGDVVDDKFVSWRVLFKNGQTNYINKHFRKGMLVKVKGEVMPYGIEQEKIVDGYSIYMDSCVMDSYPRTAAKEEKRLIRNGELSNEKPDLDAYNTPDF